MQSSKGVVMSLGATLDEEPQDELDGRSETQVWVTASDPLYVRADLLIEREGRLGAVVDGILLDLGRLNDELQAAIDLASQVHVRAGHYLGGLIERTVPLVRQ